MFKVGDPFRFPEHFLANKDWYLHYGGQENGDQKRWQNGAEGKENHHE